jgi:hypothetical protein
VKGVARHGQKEWCHLFSPVARKEDPLPPLHNPHPFYFCLFLDIWQWEEWEEIRVRTLPYGVGLRTLKRDLMDIREPS